MCSISSYPHWIAHTPWMAQETRSTAYDTQSYEFIMAAWPWLTLVVIVCAWGVARFFVAWWKLAGESSAANEFGGPGSLLDGDCWIVIACRACVWKLCRDTQEDTCGTSSWGGAMTTTMEQVVTQLQQEPLLFELKSLHNLDWQMQCRWSTTLPQLKFGRPKEFCGKKKGFQQWSKKTEAFFAGVIKESEMMLECAAEQSTEITTELINRDFLPTATNQERGVVCAAADAYSTYGSHELWGEWHCCQLAKEPIVGMADAAEAIWSYHRRKEEKPSSHDFSWTLLSLLELQAGIKRWESYVSRYEKKLKYKMNDEIKLAGWPGGVGAGGAWEAFASQLESLANFCKMRVWISWRMWRRSSVWEFLIPSRVTRVWVITRIPWMLGRSTLSLSAGKGKGSSWPRDGCFECDAAHFQRDCNASKNTGMQSSGKGKVKATERVKRTRENPKGSPKDPKVPKAHARVKRRKLAPQVLKTWNQWDRVIPLTHRGFTMNGVLTNGTTAGISMNGMMTGVVLDGMKTQNNHMTHL